MKKLKEKTLDLYLDWPILVDAALIIMVWTISKYFPFIGFQLKEKGTQTDIIANLIGTSVSLAGFLLAALTIIVTFKSNIKAKGLEEANNAMEMILSSRHYNNIVRVFKIAIIEFTICFVVLACLWIASDNFSIWTLNRINVSAIISISFTIFRSLLVLFLIIDADTPGED